MKIDINRIAELANLKLSRDEFKNLEIQLPSILKYIEKLQELNTDNVAETSQVTELKNITKKDITVPSLSQEEALSNVKSKENGLIKVKAIFEEQ